jgi:3'-phosphoadenosine 5'-phosphosulfate sulfotransferase
MSWLQEHQNNPRVRRMLQDIESGRADPRLNAAIEQMRRQEQRGFPQRPPQR